MKTKGNNMKKKILAIALLFSLALVLLASCKKKEAGKSDGGAFGRENAENVYGAPDYDDLMKKLEEARKINPKASAWLDIPGTEISYPVIVDTDNHLSYWLNRNLKGEVVQKYEETVVFGSDENNKDSKNTVIYGHNWNNIRSPFVTEPRESMSMFDLLPAFTDLDFSSKYQYIYLATDDGMRIFHVFSVMYTEQDWTDALGFNYIDPNPTDEQYSSMVEEFVSRSDLTFDLDVTSKDRLITLSTCTREVAGNTEDDIRYVVTARELRKGEEDDTVVYVEENEDAKKPNL